MPTNHPPSHQLVDHIVELLDEKKAVNITTLQVAHKSNITDYFVICEGLSTTHLGTLAKFITTKIQKDLHQKPQRINGIEEKEWVVIDYIDVIIHIFLPSIREHFKLEDLWAADLTSK